MRYLWPALPLIFSGSILLFLDQINTVDFCAKKNLLLIPYGIFLVFNLATNIRLLAVSESLIIEYQYAGSLPLDRPYVAFAAFTDQKKLCSVVENLPRDKKIFSNFREATYNIAFCSGRSLERLSIAAKSGDYFVWTPGDLELWNFLGSPEKKKLFDDSFELISLNGDYRVYKIER